MSAIQLLCKVLHTTRKAIQLCVLIIFFISQLQCTPLVHHDLSEQQAALQAANRDLYIGGIFKAFHNINNDPTKPKTFSSKTDKGGALALVAFLMAVDEVCVARLPFLLACIRLILCPFL